MNAGAVLISRGFLDPVELAELLALVEGCSWRPGVAPGAAGQVKRNSEAIAPPMPTSVPVGEPINNCLDRLADRVLAHLQKSRVVESHAWPRRFCAVMVNRYEAGDFYGPHFDSPMIGSWQDRTDLSFTLALEQATQGGELEIEGSALPPLEPGDLVIYPSDTLHSVRPIVRGRRTSVVGWIHSWIRAVDHRTILAALRDARAELEAAGLPTEHVTRAFHACFRMWCG